MCVRAVTMVTKSDGESCDKKEYCIVFHIPDTLTTILFITIYCNDYIVGCRKRDKKIKCRTTPEKVHDSKQ